MQYISSREIESALDYNSLIAELEIAFQKEYNIPKRHHHNFPNPPHEEDSTLLLMPAWEAGKDLGVKVVTVSPQNVKKDLPSIYGLYLYFDATTGKPLAVMEARTLTKMRTAASSALASKYLSRENATTLLMIGTGALAPELIKAHCLVRPGINRVLVWGRRERKVQEVIENLQLDKAILTIARSIQEGIEAADIVSCATLSKEPLVEGRWVEHGQHIDLVGSYLPEMREADDDLILKSEVYVDTLEGAPSESGDIAIPLREKLIGMDDIHGDLPGLCRGKVNGRKNNEEITLFKSVGHAIEDLVAAKLVFGALNDRQ